MSCSAPPLLYPLKSESLQCLSQVWETANKHLSQGLGIAGDSYILLMKHLESLFHTRAYVSFCKEILQ